MDVFAAEFGEEVEELFLVEGIAGGVDGAGGGGSGLNYHFVEGR